MAKIRHTGGGLFSASDKLITIHAGDENSFKLVEIKEEDILDGFVDWILYDKQKKTALDIVQRTLDKPYQYSLSEKRCGYYNYYLTASYISSKNKKKETVSINLSGHYTMGIYIKHINIAPQFAKTEDLYSVFIEMYGANGNKLCLEVFCDEDGSLKQIDSLQVESVEGNTSFLFDRSHTKKWKANKKCTSPRIKMKLKNNSGNNKGYILHNENEFIVDVPLKPINPSKPPQIELPANKSVAKVGQLDKCTAEDPETKFVLNIRKEVPEEKEVKINGRTKKIVEYKPVDEPFDSPKTLYVCTEVEFSVSELKQNLKPGHIEWSVTVGDDAPLTLRELVAKKQITVPYQIQGESVYFRIPKEWGQKQVTVTAYFTDRNTKLEQKLEIRDHIAAAFYRLNGKNPIDFSIQNVKEAEGAWHLVNFIPPFYHIQGMYRDGNDFYFAGSTRVGTPPYIYRIGGINGIDDFSGCTHDKTYVYFQGALAKYGHPGGIQTAGNILAAGFEAYDPLGLATEDRSVIGFFDKKNATGLPPGRSYKEYLKEKTDRNFEYKQVRIVRDMDYLEKFNPDFDVIYDKEANKIEDIFDKEGKKIDRGYMERYIFDKYERSYHGHPELDIIFADEERKKTVEGIPPYMNDRASAAGIILLEAKNMYLVAVRGNNRSIHFYQIDGKEPKKVSSVRPRIDNVGEFQNVNLIQDERGEIYLFGMGSENKKSVCRLYKVVMYPEDNDIALEAVYIDSSGRIVSNEVFQNDCNKVTFDCPGEHTKPRFHWSSCVYIETPVGISEQDSEEKFPGFKGKMAVYTSGGKVEKDVKIEKDDNYKRFKDFCDTYPSPDRLGQKNDFADDIYLNKKESDHTSEIADANRWWSEFNKLQSRLNYRVNKSEILCRYYTDEQASKKTAQ